MAKDYYIILGVTQQATPDDIKKAYRSLSKKWHPDKNPHNADEAKKRFQEISEAYQVLINDDTKRSYENSRRHGYSNFEFNIPSEYFKSSDELFREMFGDKTLDEALSDFLNDPIFRDIPRTKEEVVKPVARDQTKTPPPQNRRTWLNWKHLLVAGVFTSAVGLMKAQEITVFLNQLCLDVVRAIISNYSDPGTLFTNFTDSSPEM